MKPAKDDLTGRPKCVVCGEVQTDIVFIQATNHNHLYVGFPVCAEHDLNDLVPDQYVMNNLIVEVGSAT